MPSNKIVARPILEAKKIVPKQVIIDFFAHNKNVLIVDDTAFNIESLSMMLKCLVKDLQIDSAGNGLEAIEKVNQMCRIDGNGDKKDEKFTDGDSAGRLISSY